MKIVSQGFRISEIAQLITEITSDGETFSILSKNVISRSAEQSADLPISEIDALIEALQEAKRAAGVTLGTPAPEGKLVALIDGDGDLWEVVHDGFSRDGGSPTAREFIEENYGPVKEVRA